MSSFFTALVFWAIFKWEIETEQYDHDIKHGVPTRHNPNRWLIFIAYMIGTFHWCPPFKSFSHPCHWICYLFPKNQAGDSKRLFNHRSDFYAYGWELYKL